MSLARIALLAVVSLSTLTAALSPPVQFHQAISPFSRSLQLHKRALLAEDLLLNIKAQLGPLKIDVGVDVEAVLECGDEEKKVELGLGIAAKVELVLKIFKNTVPVSHAHTPAPSAALGHRPHPGTGLGSATPSCNLLGLLYMDIVELVTDVLLDVDTVLEDLPDVRETVQALEGEIELELILLIESLVATVDCVLETILNIVVVEDLEKLGFSALKAILL